MEAWAEKAMLRWPDVPALFGWLGLDRRGRWLIRGEPITRPQIIVTIGRNYEPDAEGRWFFQNGPQRGYVALEYTPLVLRVADRGDRLVAQTGREVSRVDGAYLDEQGALLLATDLGPGLLLDADLPWALARLHRAGEPIDEAALMGALARSSGAASGITMRLGGQDLELVRLDADAAPARLNYVRAPQPG